MIFTPRLIVVLLLALLGLSSAKLKAHHLPPLKEQAKLQDGWREERLATIPSILQERGVDAWLISQREYAEDTAFWSMKKATQFSARRRTLSIFFADPAFESKTWIDNTPGLWDELKDILEACDPGSIAINVDSEIAFAGGLHAGEFQQLLKQLGSPWKERLFAVPLVAVQYIATQPRSRLFWYQKLMETAWAVIDEGFSERTITPDVTTTEDVEWWFREKLQSMNYSTWFHPSVTVLPGFLEPNMSMEMIPRAEKAIKYGDLLHVDFGLTALGLNTDTQHLAYVLPPGHSKKDIPTGLLAGLRKGNRLQDIVKSHMKIGLTGNEVLARSRKAMHDEGIEGRIYCHPIGDWGHSAGAVIGMTNLQDGVPVLGDLPILKNMYYSIELFVEHFVEERNETLIFPLEEDVYWDRETRDWKWVFGRQEEFHLVRTKHAGKVEMVVQKGDL
ncbi:uncharacterized protein MYCFIDRAFT_132635 [Pseudocercospora fijiensis CIRAD86]|uniref:Peptidase M24 domain-containing protein n=1 Tax=Pseudocercospora fijiensis (strain CIRAD86) TaxID=383855 RepID=M2Z720_PSEFD|nr:uncharacterized protein MYCFIDRAFT_132635 [Pseudocercospora fijiensis CIRAD86]EME85585.1 hypothetical protein MYCFIDRAFT_132635 [Pseudocercospora fijiensis CIRAD86]